MTDTEFTLTSPLSPLDRHESPLLALTIVWHPDVARIGEQYVFAGTGAVELNRYLPLFARPGAEGLPLGHGAISRDRLLILRGVADEIEIRPPSSRMVVELNGAPVTGPVRLAGTDMARGAMLGLGRTVLLCLHWMRCLPKHNPVPGLAGVGGAAIAVRDQIRLAAPTSLPVLLLGETGTGKEVAARAVHALGTRAGAPLVAVNMATLNETLAAADLFGAVKGAYTGAHTARQGLFAEADGATLFLDEIGNTPAAVQPMMLRVLEGGVYRPLGAAQDRHSNARLIAATDQQLGSAQFNQALLRRLESFVVHMPPLRERREDIGVLIVHVLALESQEGRAAALPFGFVSAVANSDWPGNIRQLAHVLKRAWLSVLAGEAPVFAPVSPQLSSQLSLQTSQHDVRRAAVDAAPRRKPAELTEQDILQAMERHGWTIQGAAQSLGISRPTMYKLLEVHSGIRRAELIPRDEISAALGASAGNVQRCASLLKTPSEALRRHLHVLGLAVAR